MKPHASLGPLDDEVVDQIVRRASSLGFEDWWSRVRASGNCAHPIRLSRHENGMTSSVYLRCKDRRASRCPSCSALYAGDTWHLVHAGLAGGEGIPASVGEHPAVFVTLTAPSFGVVHAAVGDRTECRPGHRGSCAHGRPLGCAIGHDRDDVIVGQPLCVDCYKYVDHALFTWHSPRLWDRFAVELRRLVRRRAGLTLRVSFVKVMEMQARGAPHFHAIIRLDRAGNTATPEPPVTNLEVSGLVELVVIAAERAHIEVLGEGGQLRTLRFGGQIDVQSISGDHADNPCAPVRAIAGYLAKYVTKSTADFGVSPRRISPSSIDRLPVTNHVRRLLHTFVQLAVAAPGCEDMSRWLHTLGYRGHTTSKSRRYSTTLGVTRARRAEHARVASAGASTGDADWNFVGAGHRTAGERYLAVTAALQHQESLWAARQLRRGSGCGRRRCVDGGPMSDTNGRPPEPVVVAVDHTSAALALGLSASRLRHHVRLGDVTPRFSGTKPIYLVSELQRFVEHLPTRPERLPPP